MPTRFLNLILAVVLAFLAPVAGASAKAETHVDCCAVDGSSRQACPHCPDSALPHGGSADGGHGCCWLVSSPVAALFSPGQSVFVRWFVVGRMPSATENFAARRDPPPVPPPKRA